MPPKTFYIGIKGVICIDNKALVLKNTDGFGKNYWDIPGGRMSEGEEIHETLKRELQEELPGIQDIKIGKLIHVYKFEHNLKDGNGLMLQFYKVDAKLPQIEISKEHSGYRWLSTDELKTVGDKNDEAYISEGYKKALELSLS